MATIFSDSFDRADSGTVDATNWTEQLTSSWSIVSNRLQGNSGGPGRACITTTSAHAAIADCRASITRISNTGTFDGGPMVRTNSAGTTGYFLDVIGTGSGSTAEIYRIDGPGLGDGTKIGSTVTGLNIPNGTVLTLQAQTVGSTVELKGYANGSQIISVVDSSSSRVTAAGQTGVIIWDSSTNVFDNFLAENLVSGSSITGTGALTASAVTASGSGTRGHVSQSADLTLAGLQAAGSGVKGITGDGAVAVTAVTLTGVSGSNPSGSGSLTAPAITTAGVGSRGHGDVPGDITLTMGTPASVSGVGQLGVQRTGSGALTLSHPGTISGTASRGWDGSGALTAPKASASGSSNIGRNISGTGALATSGMFVNGVGVFGHTGTGALNSPKASVTGNSAGAGVSFPEGSLTASRPAVFAATKSAHGGDYR